MEESYFFSMLGMETTVRLSRSIEFSAKAILYKRPCFLKDDDSGNPPTFPLVWFPNNHFQCVAHVYVPDWINCDNLLTFISAIITSMNTLVNNQVSSELPTVSSPSVVLCV